MVHLPHLGTSQEGREASGLNSYKTGGLSQYCVGFPSGLAAGTRWRVACALAVALARSLCFPGCEGLLMCPPDPGLGGSNSGRALQALLPASAGDHCHQVPGPGWAPLCPAGAQSSPVVERDRHRGIEAGQTLLPGMCTSGWGLAGPWPGSLCPFRPVWEEVV